MSDLLFEDLYSWADDVCIGDVSEKSLEKRLTLIKECYSITSNKYLIEIMKDIDVWDGILMNKYFEED